MGSHEYKPGDRVIIYQHGKPTRCTTVAAVKSYKRKAKVTLADASEWDASGSRWGASAWDTLYMTAATDEGLGALAMEQRRAAVGWVADNWAKLSDEQRTAIGDLARATRKAEKP